ncbi:MAG: LysR family transcriptional regulator [Lachnospiraceae bacterium]|nr:LysR family transcriptional regulator [Lachnospiraceae bacterium]
MNTLQIKCFMALAECGSFSETAEKMYVAQPTLSKYIMSMESELELQLVDRSHRKIQLTQEGSLIYEYFKNATGDFTDVLFQAHNLGKEQDTLSVVLLEGLDTDRVLKPLLDYQFFNGNVSLSFEQLPSYQIPTFLANGKYDLAVTMEDRIQSSIRPKKNIKYEVAMPSRLNLFYSVFHPVNQLARSPAFIDFKNDIFYFPMYYSKILEDERSQVNAPIDLYRDLLGYTPNIKVVDSMASILPNLLNGSGVSILGEHSRVNSSQNIKSIVTPIKCDIVYAWCEERETDLIRDILTYNREHPTNKFL